MTFSKTGFVFLFLAALLILGCLHSNGSVSPSAPVASSAAVSSPTSSASIPSSPSSGSGSESPSYAVSTLTLNPGETKVPAGAVSPDGKYGYFVAWNNQETDPKDWVPTLVKFSLSDWGTDAKGHLQGGHLVLMPPVPAQVDRDGKPTLYKQFEPVFWVIDPKGQTGVVGFGRNFLEKVDLNAFATGSQLNLRPEGDVASLHGNAGDVVFNPNTGVMDPSGSFVYVLGSLETLDQTSIYRLFKIRLSDFSVAAYSDLHADFGIPMGLTIDPKGQFLYVGGVGNPDVSLVRMKTSDLSLDNTLTLVKGQQAGVVAGGSVFSVIDSQGRFGYFSVRGLHSLFKVDLASFTLVGSLDPSPAFMIYSMAMDPKSKFLYVGESSGTVDEVSLDDFSVSNTIQTGFFMDPNFQGDASSTLEAAAMDPQGRAVYFGTTFGNSNARPGNVVRITLTS